MVEVWYNRAFRVSDITHFNSTIIWSCQNRIITNWFYTLYIVIMDLIIRINDCSGSNIILSDCHIITHRIKCLINPTNCWKFNTIDPFFMIMKRSKPKLLFSVHYLYLTDFISNSHHSTIDSQINCSDIRTEIGELFNNWDSFSVRHCDSSAMTYQHQILSIFIGRYGWYKWICMLGFEFLTQIFLPKSLLICFFGD